MYSNPTMNKMTTVRILGHTSQLHARCTISEPGEGLRVCVRPAQRSRALLQG